MPVTRFNPFSNDDAESSQSMQTEEVHPDEVRVYPTPRIVDAAVNSSLQDMQVDDSTANALRSALINDPLSTVSESYYHGVAARTMKPSNYLSQKKRLTIPYTLTEQQVSSLTAYAVDFDLRFVASEPHDHPQAAACRSVDRMLVNSRIPPNATVSDVGASLVPLVLSGELAKKVHACSPLVDKKDPARNKLAMMRMNMISKSQEYSDRVRASAKLVLEKNPLAVCNRRVQECMHKSTAITSIHVYDVPIEHWGRIMEQKGANLLEGCILFPADIYNKSSGTMEAAGARYEVDALSNKFRMGFVGSPAWWYEHSLSEYMRYGIDQVILGEKYRFAYKIVERRGDTIFFRILKTEARMEPNARQCFKMPGVQMVTVNGFPVDQGRPHVDTIRRRKYSFPRNLWEDMLMHAKEMVERNTLSHERLYNYYRTVSPRQSINSVIVTGGSSVEDISQLLPLICHVALFALKEVAQSKMDTSHLINAEMERRSKATETTVYKAARAFVEALEYSLKFVFAPLSFIKDKLDKGVTHCLLRNTFSWDIQPVVHYVPVKLLLYNCYATDTSAVCDEQPYLDGGCMQDEMADLVETAQGSSDIANLLLEALGDELDSAQVQSLTAATLVDTPSETAVPTQPDTASAPTVSSAHVSTLIGSDPSCRLIDAQEVERRKLSIMEAIGECEAEEQKVTAACASQVQDLSLVEPLNGSSKDITNPNLTQMLKYTELYSNPDFWYVRRGRIDKSLRGLDPQGFPYACVYTRAEYEGTFLRPVSEHYYEGMSEGRYVERTYYMVPGEYTGWVYTNDALMIQNGRAISRALRAALDKPLTFEVRLMQGPPGCGKTTSIVNSCLPTDIVLVPVRKAARETADRLKAKSAAFADMVKTRVRTVDSYLVNCLSSKMIGNLTTDRLMADEAFMTREGRWLAAAALLGAAEIHAYGDKMQIPHTPRASCAKDHVTLQYQHMEETFLSYRCPPEAVACFKAYYGDKIRSASVVQGDIRHLTTTSGLSIPKNCVMMGMYQSDKKELQRLYGSCGVPIKIMTVHESQGNTYKDVWLHRFDKRVRTDRLSLYDQNSYVDVAMSRCTHSFYYIAPDNMRDVVTEWVRVGKDPRRIKAAADVSSAGEVLEVL